MECNNAEDELGSIRICLKWCALDHSSPVRKLVSYLAFLLFAFVVPASTTLYFSSSAGPVTFNQLVQLPETVLASVSFLTLAAFFRRHGLRRLLLVDDALLRDDPASVRSGYTGKLNRVFRYIAYILLPSFSAEILHKVLLFTTVPLPHMWTVAMAATVAAWVYRTGVFLLVCVFFRLTCELQILRLEGFCKMLEGEDSEDGYDECLIFKEHMRIKRLLLVISHRYRIFIIGSLMTITISQLGALMLVLTSKTEKDFCNSGDIVVCSFVQLTGFLMCLLGAARITHRARKVVPIASRWHMTLTSTSYTKPDAVTPRTNDEPNLSEQGTSSTFNSRQALLTYLQHNGGGITIFGFPLDRGLLQTIFVFEVTQTILILGKFSFHCLSNFQGT